MHLARRTSDIGLLSGEDIGVHRGQAHWVPQTPELYDGNLMCYYRSQMII
jgi:hypothetical protein